MTYHILKYEKDGDEWRRVVTLDNLLLVQQQLQEWNQPCDLMDVGNDIWWAGNYMIMGDASYGNDDNQSGPADAAIPVSGNERC